MFVLTFTRYSQARPWRPRSHRWSPTNGHIFSGRQGLVQTIEIVRQGGVDCNAFVTVWWTIRDHGPAASHVWGHII